MSKLHALANRKPPVIEPGGYDFIQSKKRFEIYENSYSKDLFKSSSKIYQSYRPNLSRVVLFPYTADGPESGVHSYGLVISYESRRIYPPESRQPGFITQALSAERTGDVDRALDIVFESIELLLKRRKFDELSTVISGIKVEELTVDTGIGLLTATLPAADQIKSRPKFYSEFEQYMKDSGQYEVNMLTGLA